MRGAEAAAAFKHAFYARFASGEALSSRCNRRPASELFALDEAAMLLRGLAVTLSRRAVLASVHKDRTKESARCKTIQIFNGWKLSSAQCRGKQTRAVQYWQLLTRIDYPVCGR